MEKINILSPAKINLSLDVISKRSDNFHNIKSYVQIIDLYDEISIHVLNSSNDIKIECSNKKIRNETNLAYIAAYKFMETFKINKGVSIHIKKNIPVGSGMGGGSSNAAAILVGLSKIFTIDNFNKIIEIGESIGSDVPLFLFCRSSIIKNKGESIELIKSPPKLNFLLIMQDLEISSKKSFRKWEENKDYIKSFHLKNKYKQITIDNNVVEIKNDFYPLALKFYPQFNVVSQIITSSGIDNHSLTGTGSTIFSIIPNELDVDDITTYLESANNLKISLNSSIEGWRFQID